MKLLIIGGSGFLGGELVRRAPAAGFTVAATYSTRPPDAAGDIARYALDVRDPAQVSGVMDEAAPSVVVNTSSGGADRAVTAEGAVRVAMTAAERGCRLVHVSSDAVFSPVIWGSQGVDAGESRVAA